MNLAERTPGPAARIAVVGGGVSGLMATWELAQLGFEVELFEAADVLGGLASSFDFDGLRIERFYHFICRTDVTLIATIGRLGLADRLRWKRTHTGFFYEGRHYPFSHGLDVLRFSPLSWTEKLQFGWGVYRASRRSDWQALEQTPAKRWLVENLGPRAYEVVWDPLLRIKFDRHHDDISAAWMWHRIHRVARSRSSPLHAEQFGYLTGGSDLLVETMAAESRALGATIHLRSPVSAFVTENGRCVGIRLGGEVRRFDAVISALPLTLVPRLLPSDVPAYLGALRELESIGVVCMILRLRQPITRDFWLNVNDRRIAFNGVIQYSQLNDDPRLRGRAIAYIPFYLDRSHPRFEYSDRRLFDEYCQALAVLRPDFDPGWVEGYRVFRAPHAQPICGLDFSQRVPEIRTPWDGLYLIESTQLYPADRIISGNLRIAQNAVAQVVQDLGHASPLPFPQHDPEEIPA